MEDTYMKKFPKTGIILLLVILLALTSASSALSQSEPQSWIKRRLTYNAGDSWHPTIAISGGNIHVVWFDESPGIETIFYKRSTDNGITWGKNLDGIRWR